MQHRNDDNSLGLHDRIYRCTLANLHNVVDFCNKVGCFDAGGLLLPETPNSLIERGHNEEARAVLVKIRGTDDVDAEYEDIVTAVEASQMVRLGNSN